MPRRTPERPCGAVLRRAVWLRLAALASARQPGGAPRKPYCLYSLCSPWGPMPNGTIKGMASLSPATVLRGTSYPGQTQSCSPQPSKGCIVGAGRRAHPRPAPRPQTSGSPFRIPHSNARRLPACRLPFRIPHSALRTPKAAPRQAVPEERLTASWHPPPYKIPPPYQGSCCAATPGMGVAIGEALAVVVADSGVCQATMNKTMG